MFYLLFHCTFSLLCSFPECFKLNMQVFLDTTPHKLYCTVSVAVPRADWSCYLYILSMFQGAWRGVHDTSEGHGVRPWKDLKVVILLTLKILNCYIVVLSPSLSLVSICLSLYLSLTSLLNALLLCRHWFWCWKYFPVLFTEFYFSLLFCCTIELFCSLYKCFHSVCYFLWLRFI